MRVVIFNMGYAGYTCACWRELSKETDIELSVYTLQTRIPYEDDILDGLPVTIVDRVFLNDPIKIFSLIKEKKPQVVLISGWCFKGLNKAVVSNEFSGVRFYIGIDSSWECSFRQLLARFVLRKFVKKINGWLVAGERGRQFVKYLGVRDGRIFFSAYGCDYSRFATSLVARLKKSSWPSSFVYVGRYSPEKGLTTLLSAYQKYSHCVESPWPLHCYGCGPLVDELVNIRGVVDHGFVQPRDLPMSLSEYGVYILPSLHEPWGVSLAEAAAAGLPLLASDKVSSSIDLLRPLYNGLLFPAGDVEELTRCLIWFHNHHECLQEMGMHSQNYAMAYSPTHWARRVMWMFQH